MHYKLKSYRLRLRRFARHSEKRYRDHPRLLPVLAGVSILFILSILAFTLRDHTDSLASSRLDDVNIVILHADDLTRALPTREETVGELLENAKVTINDGDVVEPALDTPIEEDDFRINVYRAAPVLIDDDGSRTMAYSAAQTPRSVADQAGLSVHPEDIVEAGPSTDFLRDGIGSKVTIKRSTPMVLNLYGASLPIRTQATTVGELLDEKGVVLQPDDSLQPSAATPLTDNIQVFVTRSGVQVISSEESIPMPVTTVEDNTLSYGTVAVRQRGSEGKKSVTYQLELRNGIEVARTKIQEVVTTAPVTQIVARGTSGKFENFNADGIPARVFCGSPKQGNWKNINVSNAALGRAMAEAKGWTGAQFNALLELFACESSWNEHAGNPNSGAYGIPQSLPASKMADPAACGGAGYLTDPQIQISWGLCYIQRRFGTPSAALDYHYRNNFY
ncbi:MAG: ubiquitin-like domain-containing protein [Candidatus Saccharimonadales bacterium]